jgi:hypothetical protein|tara:strand:+ start:150 stop:380 length:231 start_codon:yes stop_codon:yes gene_type:complete
MCNVCIINVLENKKGRDKMKRDKLDFIATLFEGETSSSFDLCIKDTGFRNLVVNHATKPIEKVVSILVDYANENLI